MNEIYEKINYTNNITERYYKQIDVTRCRCIAHRIINQTLTGKHGKVLSILNTIQFVSDTGMFVKPLPKHTYIIPIL